MFTALLVGETVSGEVSEALADAGCLDIKTSTDLERLPGTPDLIVVDLVSDDLRTLLRVVKLAPETPIVALCNDRQVDAVLQAGATECATKPLRSRELAGRIRGAVRARTEARHRSSRERRMSETIVSLQREKHDLERLVCVDSLTGIANRRHALSLLETEWGRSTRDHAPLGFVMIDLDCYHAYNEQYGHLGGDACLQRVADAMVRCLRRPSDYLGRYGGEEFIAVLPNTDAVGAKLVAERLRAAVEALAIPHAASACARVVTITAGFASLRAASDLSVDKLIAVADGALLKAKADGRNRIEGAAPLVRPVRISAQRWQRFAAVWADPWFADRIPMFLTDAHAGARGILDVLRLGDARLAAEIAGDLLASARELGMSALEVIARELERAAAANEAQRASAAAEELIQYITHVQVIYRRPTEVKAVEPSVQPTRAASCGA